MAKILKYFILILFWTVIVQSCKSTHTTTTKDHFVSDTLIKHSVAVITLPTNYTFIDKNPCKNDSLVISNQSLVIGKLKIKISNLNGQLVIETNTDSIINSKVKEILKHTEKKIITIKSEVLKKHIPKWVWYVLGTMLIYIVYRVARIYFPIIKFLPY